MVKQALKPPDWRRSRTGFEPGPKPDPMEWPLPEDYLDMVTSIAGGEGFVGPEYVRFYHLNEVLPLNEAYDVARYATGFLIIGSNAGGEAYAFDFRSKAPSIVRIPFIPMTPSLAEPVADTITDFLSSLLLKGEIPNADWSMCIDSGGVCLEIHEIKPIVFGGDPADKSNKILLRPPEHAKLCRFWNKLYAKVAAQANS